MIGRAIIRATVEDEPSRVSRLVRFLHVNSYIRLRIHRLDQEQIFTMSDYEIQDYRIEYYFLTHMVIISIKCHF